MVVFVKKYENKGNSILGPVQCVLSLSCFAAIQEDKYLGSVACGRLIVLSPPHN